MALPNQKSLLDLPEKFLVRVADKLDFPSQARLRTVCKELGKIVDQAKPSIDALWCDFNKDRNLKLSAKIGIFNNQQGKHDKDVSAEKHYDEEDLEAALDDIENFLKNPRLQLNFFIFYNSISPVVDMQLIEISNALDHQLEVKYLKLGLNGVSLVNFLRKINPNTLKTIGSRGKLEPRDIDRLVQLEQWKKAERIDFKADFSDFSRLSRHFLHFKRVEIEVVSFSIDEMLSMKQFFNQSNKLEVFSIDGRNNLTREGIEFAFGPPVFEFKKDKGFYPHHAPGTYSSFAIQGTKDFFKLGFYESQVILARSDKKSN
uniref:F-box domain-containing protein n=1 Tax=Caenorhabditis tropicalis TaxID=1561998 RepID=A0A1I7TRX9_9PELO